MNRLRRNRADVAADGVPPDVIPARNKPLSHEEQRLMFEGSVHWGRGLAILLGMAAVLVVFLVILTALPRPSSDLSLDSLTNFGSSNNVSLTGPAGATATAAPVAAARLSTVAPAPVLVGATGTPAPGWTGAVRSGAPNVRSAPNTNNTPVGNLQPGQQVQVLGRSADNAWYQIVWNGNQKAWVASDLLNIVSGDATRIPLVSP